MVVCEDGFKYMHYDAASIEEKLLNLNENPYETTLLPMTLKIP